MLNFNPEVEDQKKLMDILNDALKKVKRDFYIYEEYKPISELLKTKEAESAALPSSRWGSSNPSSE